MGILKKLSKILTSSPRGDPNAYWIYAKCNRCGEKLRSRVDLRNELSPEYSGGDQAASYHSRKVLMGDGLCFQQVEVVMKFDSHQKLVDRHITGGVFISEDEWASAG